MVGNDVQEDGAAAQLGMPVFILTDCLIDRMGDLSKFPHGGFPELNEWLETRSRFRKFQENRKNFRQTLFNPQKICYS